MVGLFEIEQSKFDILFGTITGRSHIYAGTPPWVNQQECFILHSFIDLYSMKNDMHFWIVMSQSCDSYLRDDTVSALRYLGLGLW